MLPSGRPRGAKKPSLSNRYGDLLILRAISRKAAGKPGGEVDEVNVNTLISCTFSWRRSKRCRASESGEGVVCLRLKELPGTAERVASAGRKCQPQQE